MPIHDTIVFSAVIQLIIIARLGKMPATSRTQLIELKTSEKVEIVDITEKVESLVKSSGVREGICVVSVPHATASVILNENEPGLLEDIVREINRLFPQEGTYMHNRIDDNASAHIAASFLGNSRIIPISGGRLIRGTWQSVLFVELDGPRERRTVAVTVMGE